MREIEQKWTTGPWVIVPQDDGSAMVAHEYDTGKQMNPKGLRLISHVLVRGNSLRQDEANARLIAAAPEMYEALRGMLKLIDDGMLVRDMSHDHESDWAMKQIPLVRTLQLAQAALAKTEATHDAS